MMKWSAALLVKLSAAQLNYHYRHYGKKRTTWVPTESQIKGNTYAASEKLGPFLEMVSSVAYRDHEIFYSFDEIFKPGSVTYFIERKQPPKDDSKLEAYMLKAVSQVALYRALFCIPGLNEFQTARFAVKAGSPSYKFAIEHDAMRVKFALQFNDHYYEISDTDNASVLKYYMTKLRAASDYNRAREFDAALGSKIEDHLGNWNYATCRQLQAASKSLHTSKA